LLKVKGKREENVEGRMKGGRQTDKDGFILCMRRGRVREEGKYGRGRYQT
jgi:hypothetical protein